MLSAALAQDELLAKVRELGALPSDVNEMMDLDSQTLNKDLARCNKELKKYRCGDWLGLGV